jgi:hypothetical protein
MNAATRSSGVSGMGLPIPDQGADLANGPKPQSCEGKEQNAQKLRVYLPAHVYARYRALSPSERRKAVAALMGSTDIDPAKLITAAAEVNRVGVLLNQFLRLAHMGRVPAELVECVQDVVAIIRSLKP